MTTVPSTAPFATSWFEIILSLLYSPPPPPPLSLRSKEETPQALELVTSVHNVCVCVYVCVGGKSVWGKPFKDELRPNLSHSGE